MTPNTAMREVKSAVDQYANGMDLPRANRLREALKVIAREFEKLGTVKVKV